MFGSRYLYLLIAGFVVFEIAARVAARNLMEVGGTINLIGPLYFVNAVNPSRSIALGWSSVAWMLIALLIISVIACWFYLSLRMLPGGWKSSLGGAGLFISCFIVSIVLINLAESVIWSGVTDYFGLINIASGRARVLNAADVVLWVSCPLVYMLLLVSAYFVLKDRFWVGAS